MTTILTLYLAVLIHNISIELAKIAKKYPVVSKTIMYPNSKKIIFSSILLAFAVTTIKLHPTSRKIKPSTHHKKLSVDTKISKILHTASYSTPQSHKTKES
ncbi:hypothetical protein ACKWTF_014601 [Chironomus riparius]